MLSLSKYKDDETSYFLTCVTALLLSFLINFSFMSGALAIGKQKVLNYQASDYFANPLLPETKDQRLIIVQIDQSLDMLERAYPATTFDANSNVGLIGFFDANKQYRYNATQQYFEEDDALDQGQGSAWDGQFLNWLVMRKLDMSRVLLLGSRVQSVLGITELAKAKGISATLIKEPQSGRYSPIPDYMPIRLKSGQLEYQNKTVFLRIKSHQTNKGLLDLLDSNTELYFYSDSTSGDKLMLLSYLENWAPNHKSQPRNNYHAVHLGALQKVLTKIKTRYSKGIPANKKQNILCQRYVHLSTPHSAHGALVLDDTFTRDCQPAIAGKQVFKSLQWGVPRKQVKTHAKNRSDYHYSEKDHLLRVMFNYLFIEETSLPLHVTGADLEQFSDGTATLYQTVSQYSIGEGDDTVNWVGDLRASLIDEQGRLRSDNGDKTLGTLAEDPLVTSCFDKHNKRLRFRLSQQTLPDSKCTALNYPYLDNDIGYLWRASKPLSKLLEKDRSIQRSPFYRDDHRRHIRTHIGQQEYDFVAGKNYPLKKNLLKLSSDKARDNFINYVRGEHQEGKRIRQLTTDTFLLGDTFKSSPVIVGQPAANYHFLYGDSGYHNFFQQYQNRRSRVFMASQNGILHSFNAGWYDLKTKKIIQVKQHLSEWELGQELWAFVPYAVLPYLKEQQQKYYGLSPALHFSLFPQKPYIFDAKVFGVNGIKGQKNRLFQDQTGAKLSHETHSHGWGTLMVVGAGLGEVRQGDFIPSYLVFDITDAEQAPKFIASIKAPNMGSAMSLPSVMTHKNTQDEVDWYLVLGSGAVLESESTGLKQMQSSAGIYLYNLKKLEKAQASLKPIYIDLQTAHSYVSGVSAVDWNLSGETDALYVNTVKQQINKTNLSQAEGALFRVALNKTSQGALSLNAEKIFTTNAPLYARPQLSVDSANNRWIHLITRDQAQQSSQQKKRGQSEDKIIGIKEPRDAFGKFLFESALGKSGAISEKKLLDVTNVLVGVQDGQLRGSWQIQPKLMAPSVVALEKRMMAFSPPKVHIPGWVRRLDKGEIPNASNTLYAGILTQATYQQNYSHCKIYRDAFVHRLRFTTGTAWFEENSKLNTTSKASVTLKDTKGQAPGSSVVSAVLLHQHGAKLQELESSKNGKTQTVMENVRDIPLSTETSWREL